MYVCMHVCMCVYVYICVCVCVHTHTHIHTHTHKHTHSVVPVIILWLLGGRYIYEIRLYGLRFQYPI